MNDTTETTIELVDTEGNVTLVPATVTTGSDSETAQPEGTVFIAEDEATQPVAFAWSQCDLMNGSCGSCDHLMIREQ